MPPEQRPAPRFFAEPPREGLPYGRWAQRLEEELRAAWSALDTSGEPLGEPGEVVWHPDRTWQGLTYVPGSCRTDSGFELFGYVRFVAAHENVEAHDFQAWGDFTEETAERNPGWQIDLCDRAIGDWRGAKGQTATITLVWGRPLTADGAIVTAELGDVTVDQCELVERRFTLIAPDDYLDELLEVGLWDARGRELARESLYEGDQPADS